MSVAHGQEGIPVIVASADKVTATGELKISGTVVAAKRSNVSVRVDGLVERVWVDAGSEVKKGDLLLTLDQSYEQQELARLSANLAAANAVNNENQRLVNEAQRLTKENHLPSNELELRSAALNESKALLEAAVAAKMAQQQRVNWHQLMAPFAGVVYRKSTERGEWVSRGDDVLELVAINTVYLDIQIPQDKFAVFKGAVDVSIYPETGSQQAISGKVHTIVAVADTASRTFRVRVVPDKPLLPGSAATAVFRYSQNKDKVLVVSRDAILRNPDGGYSLFIVAEKQGQLTAMRKQITLGQQLGNKIEVLTGIDGDDKVVIRGNEILRNNQQVYIADKK
ncbi:MAG: efflux RND transporter periplasmic adaptor subunit [Pseudomonadales bacterium]|nr:efflux RND transporter periplasmic adaptor subunit [Pseudomonadales bacterium]